MHASIKPLAWALAALLLTAACGDDDPATDGGGLPSGGSGGSGDSGKPEPPDLRACEASSDCVVVPASCCGSCGAATRGDAIAIASARAGEYSASQCEDSQGCPACAPLFIDPTLVPTCREERCELVDLLEHEASACSADDECFLRTPDCCPCGGDTSPGRVIAIASEDAYAPLVCDPDQACGECAPIYPIEVTASCSASGRCETRDTRLPNIEPGPPDSGTADSGAPDSGMLDSGALDGDAGGMRPALCSLPAEIGNCDAIIGAFHYEPSTDRCEGFIWGGCGGNANRFASAAACAETCHPGNPPPLACEVDGVVYAHGTIGIDDPRSCNTCSCLDGELTACTEIACPEQCPEGTTFDTDCASCGPVDNCELVRTGCLETCAEQGDCDEGACIGNVCKNLCG